MIWSGRAPLVLLVALAVAGTSLLLAEPRAAAAPLYEDGFDTYDVGVSPPGWVDTAANNSMVVDDSLFSVAQLDNTRALATSSTATNIHSHYLADGSDTAENYVSTGRLRTTAPDSGIGITVLSDYTDTDAYYRLRRYGTNGAFHLDPHGTTITGGNTETGVVPSPNTWYRYRIEVLDTGTRTEIRANVWAENTTEPNGWQINAHDNSPTRRTSGTFGVWSMGPGTKYWDDTTVTPTGELGPHDLTVTTTGEGTVDVSPGAGPFEHRSELTVTATPAPGWVFTGWTGDLTSAENPLVLTIDSELSLNAEFQQVQPVTLDVTTNGSGTVTIEPDSTEYQVGDTVTITATANTGWTFTGWSGATNGATNPLALQLLADTELTADFAERPDEWISDDYEGHDVGVSPPGWVDTAANNSMVVDDSLFSVAQVDDTRALATSSTATNIHSHYLADGSDTAENYVSTGRLRTTAPDSGIGITVLSDYTDTDAYYRLRRYGTNGAFHLDPHGTTITGGNTETGVVPSPNTWYRYRIEVLDTGTRTEIRANVWAENTTEPNGWQINAHDNSPTRRTSGTFGVWSMGPGTKYWDDTTVTPTGELGPHDLTVTTTGEGTVDVSPGAGPFEHRSELTVTATPAPGWVFTGWTGDLTSAENPLVLTIDSELSLNAEFQQVQPVTLDVTTNGSGTVTIEPDSTEYQVGDTVTITATANTGWTFTGWSGATNGATNPLVLQLLADTELTADFAERPDEWISDDYEGHDVGVSPPGWVDTAANNSMVVDDSLFSVAQVDDTRALATSSTATNIHSHYLADGSDTAENYVSTGRLRTTAPDSGIGITVLSDYTDTDAYYRLRRYGTNGAFHLDPHGTTITGGNTETGVVPSPNTWYRYRIEVLDTGTRTEIRANVWAENTTEPNGWQINAHDNSPTRRTSGTFGVWSMGPGTKYWDDTTVTPTGEPVESFTLDTEVVGSGTVEADPDATTYGPGDPVTLTAVPAPGWVFTGWTGDASGSNAVVELTMDADRSVTAAFEPSESVSLSVDTQGDGSVEVDPAGEVQTLGDTVTLRATPSPGWAFDRWQVNPGQIPDWWHPGWGYRIPLVIDPGQTARTDLSLDVDLDFTAAWAALDVDAEFDPASLRVVERAPDGAISDSSVPFQFDESESHDPQTNAAGTLTLLMTGSTDVGAPRRYDVYFDDVGAGHAPAVVGEVVSVTDGVIDAGEDTFRISTPAVTYYFDKDGGGFTSIVDPDGADWIGYGPAAGSAGQFRGIPNLVFPEGYMHPGAEGVTSTLVNDGPLRTTIRSTTTGGNWVTEWDIFSDRARMTVLAADQPYWFLYEGTPGGQLDPQNDTVVRSSGAQTTAGTSWSGDLPGEEWAYVADPQSDRSLFVANHQDDTAVDSYYPLNNDMTVFGFGRSGVQPLMTGAPAQFSIGLVDGVDAPTVSPTIHASMRPIEAVAGTPEQRGVPLSQLEGDVISFALTADQTVTAKFSQLETDAQPRIVTGEVDFTKQVVDDSVLETHAAVAADFTGNGHLDLVATDYVNGRVTWYENDGSGGFIDRVLDPALPGAYPVAVADVDGDGHIDVLAGGYQADQVVWYQNDGGGSFTRRLIDDAADGAHSVVAADLDGDGHKDLLVTNQDAGTVTWYHNDGAQSFTLRTIDPDADGAKRAEVGDVNGDGHLDVVVASFWDNRVAWHQNDGAGNFTKRVVDSNARGAYYAEPSDVDGDGDLDIFAASQLDDTVAWYRNNGTGTFTKLVIDSSARRARSVVAADVDGNGTMDAVATSVDDNAVIWYENDGAGDFRAHAVDVSALGAYGVDAVDFDGDGTTDVVSASRDSAEVAIHRQSRAHMLTVEPLSTTSIGSAQLSTVDDDGGPDQLVYTLLDGPSLGTLLLDGAPLGAAGTFTQRDVDQDRIGYLAGVGGPTADTFTFSVWDGAAQTVPRHGSFTIRVAQDQTLMQLGFDEGDGTFAADSSGNGRHGALVNGATFDPTSADGSPSSASFDGIDDAVAVEGFATGGTGLTLAAWFNADSFATADARLISKATGSATSDHVFMLSTFGRMDGTTVLRARVRVNGSTHNLVASAGAASAGAWHHAATTHDGEELRLFLDGKEVASTVVGGVVEDAVAVPVAVGAQPPGAGGGHFDGRIDDVRIVGRALSPTEVSELATPVEPPPDPDPGPVVDIWYGDQQNLTRIASSQRWVNVVGNVSGDEAITSLSYRLNGGQPRGLNIGPNLRRLVRPGDFNADIAVADLQLGSNSLEITAIDALGVSTTRNVELLYDGAADWATPLAVDWSQLSAPDDAVGIVDGKWRIDDGNLRTDELGYDRMVSIGGLGWTDYEVEVPVTVHEVDLGRPFQSGPPLIGFIHRWSGHNNSLEPWNPFVQPFQGFLPDGISSTPLGSMTHVRWNSGTSTPAEAWNHRTLGMDSDSSLVLELGATYRLKSRVETLDGGSTFYGFKVWPEGTPEPGDWAAEFVAGTNDLQPASGSLLLVAHEADVSFGTVDVQAVSP